MSGGSISAVPTAKGGRGKKGGLSEYAAKIGKHRQNVEIIELLVKWQKTNIDCNVFLGRAQHLAAIHKLPPNTRLLATRLRMASEPGKGERFGGGKMSSVDQLIYSVAPSTSRRGRSKRVG